VRGRDLIEAGLNEPPVVFGTMGIVAMGVLANDL